MGWDRKHFDGNDLDLRPRLELIVEIIGDKPCDQITREDTFALIDHVAPTSGSDHH